MPSCFCGAAVPTGIIVVLLSSVAAAADYSVESVTALPDGVSADLGKAVAANGNHVVGPDGPLCTVWLATSPDVKEGFSPTLSVKYALVPGSLVGLLRVDEGTEFTDFREQVISPGVYTLRYGQQPQDGNHIGTSDLADFLLVAPAASDKSPQTLELDELVELSTEASGTAHPAILSLRPTDGAKPGDVRLNHDAADDLWILEAAAGAEKPLVLRVVVVGFALE